MNIHVTFLSFGLIIMLSFGGCSKSDLPEPASGFNRVRLYDDTLPDPRSRSTRIAAGDGRIFMTYGTTPEQIIFLIGSLIYPPPHKCVWMLTDNDGNLLRRDTFPSGLAIGDAIALPDNSFLIIAYTGVQNLWGGSVEWGLYFMRLDANGVMSPAQVLDAPVNGTLPYQQITNIQLFPAQNGNVLLSFGYQGIDIGSTFIGEMNAQGDFLWHKESDVLLIDDCEMVPGGGYMVSCGIWDPVIWTTTRMMMRTNSVFDSVWVRHFTPAPEASGKFQLAFDGGRYYWLNYLASQDGKTWSHVYKMNAEAEIVDSAFYPVSTDYYISLLGSVILPHGNGVFVSHFVNNINDRVLDRYNSMYAILDDKLDVTRSSTFQEQTSDQLNDGCLTSDGEVACFGVTQISGRFYYKPELIILK